MAEGRPACRRAVRPSRSNPPFRSRSRGTRGTAGRAFSGWQRDRTATGPRRVAVHDRRRHIAGGSRGIRAGAQAGRAARRRTPAVHGLWQSAAGSGDVLAGRKLSNQLLQLTADKADDRLLLQAHHSAWTTCFRSGEPAAERKHSEAGRRLYDPERHLSHRSLYGGHDPGVCAANHSAQAHWLLGYPKKALVIGSEALALAERVAHPLSLDQALFWDAVLHLDRGDPQLALERLRVAEALAAEQRLGLFLMEPRFLRGAALSAQGAFEDAVACLREGLAGRLAMRDRPYGLNRYAEALVRQGEHGAALA